MTCCMRGGGPASTEPDIPVAMFRAARAGSILTVYEPNLARVPVEDRKGLELALILGAEVVRDLYLVPRHDPFHTAGPARVDAETRRLRAMVASEERLARERRREQEQRDRDEQDRIRRMLRDEDVQRRRREEDVERETERLRRLYGVGPPLPPRPGPRPHEEHFASGALACGQVPRRPNSTGPPAASSGGVAGPRKHFLGALFGPHGDARLEDGRRRLTRKRSL
ncbi:hypothetical protein E4U53_004762 [Claviceps sorghi]|nr:hypothetical protein E4U53_004762 [Claviceps sorghi]